MKEDSKILATIKKAIDIAKKGAVTLRDPASLKKHPKNDFPEIPPGKKWESFKASIKKLGVIHPVVIDANDRILSGAQRTRACAELGIKVPTVKIRSAIDPKTARQIIVMLNIDQRDLSREEMDKYWKEVYAPIAKSLLKGGHTAAETASKIAEQSGMKFTTARREVAKMVSADLARKYKDVDSLPLSDGAKRSLKPLVKDATELLDRIERLALLYQEARSKIAAIIPPDMFRLPETYVQRHPDERIPASLGTPPLTINKIKG